MAESSRRSMSAVAVVLAILAACTVLLLVTPRSAEAAWNTYCDGQTVSGWAYGASYRCNGANRNLYAVYGWGDQTSICVGASWGVGGGASVPESCAPRGVGAYSNWGTSYYFSPYIYNQSQWNSTVVHGIAYIP